MLNENGAPLEQFSSHFPTSEGPLIGNLLLSSCPGKKVRLDEPFQGRSPICRDLKIDLDRIRQMGVRAIVCCLDDEELNMLGAPCHEYQEQAQSQGFDLICLPMAEGFAPINMTRLDMIMSMLILNYTLRGTSILVHCRGCGTCRLSGLYLVAQDESRIAWVRGYTKIMSMLQYFISSA